MPYKFNHYYELQSVATGKYINVIPLDKQPTSSKGLQTPLSSVRLLFPSLEIPQIMKSQLR